MTVTKTDVSKTLSFLGISPIHKNNDGLLKKTHFSNALRGRTIDNSIINKLRENSTETCRLCLTIITLLTLEDDDLKRKDLQKLVLTLLAYTLRNAHYLYKVEKTLRAKEKDFSFKPEQRKATEAVVSRLWCKEAKDSLAKLFGAYVKAESDFSELANVMNSVYHIAEVRMLFTDMLKGAELEYFVYKFIRITPFHSYSDNNHVIRRALILLECIAFESDFLSLELEIIDLAQHNEYKFVMDILLPRRLSTDAFEVVVQKMNAPVRNALLFPISSLSVITVLGLLNKINGAGLTNHIKDLVSKVKPSSDGSVPGLCPVNNIPADSPVGEAGWQYKIKYHVLYFTDIEKVNSALYHRCVAAFSGNPEVAIEILKTKRMRVFPKSRRGLIGGCLASCDARIYKKMFDFFNEEDTKIALEYVIKTNVPFQKILFVSIFKEKISERKIESLGLQRAWDSMDTEEQKRFLSSSIKKYLDS